jgi:hypothetical protein
MSQHATALKHAEPVEIAHELASVPEGLYATERAVLAAHEAHLRAALGSVSWERRGFLQRLTRSPLPR